MLSTRITKEYSTLDLSLFFMIPYEGLDIYPVGWIFICRISAASKGCFAADDFFLESASFQRCGAAFSVKHSKASSRRGGILSVALWCLVKRGIGKPLGWFIRSARIVCSRPSSKGLHVCKVTHGIDYCLQSYHNAIRFSILQVDHIWLIDHFQAQVQGPFRSWRGSSLFIGLIKADTARCSLAYPRPKSHFHHASHFNFQ